MIDDAVFAGKLFVPGEQNGYRFYMWGDAHIPNGQDDHDGAIASTTVAEPADGAFLCKLDNGWLFVAGAHRHSPLIHTFFDDSPQAGVNAVSMQSLGIPILTMEEGNERIKMSGKSLHSITAEERQRKLALERAKSRMRAQD